MSLSNSAELNLEVPVAMQPHSASRSEFDVPGQQFHVILKSLSAEQPTHGLKAACYISFWLHDSELFNEFPRQ